MKTSELEGAELDYWVARGLHEFIREIHFTDGGQTLSIRGNDRGRAWDGRFLPSTSWEAASVVLERACRLEMSDHGRGEVVCTATFGKAGAEVEGRGASLRIALLRAFLLHAFGDTVDDEFPHRSQMLLGERAELLGEQSAAATIEDAPLPDGRIGDIGSTARQ
jgi:Protein of unknown function (DUF2591)